MDASVHPVDPRTSQVTNFVGLLGERAVEHYLASLGVLVRSIADDEDAIRECRGDLELTSPTARASVDPLVTHVEVKTSGQRRWENSRRAPLDAYQYELRNSHADACVLCVVDGSLAVERHMHGSVVRLMGWWPINASPDQGPEDTAMRPVADLMTWVRNEWSETKRRIALNAASDDPWRSESGRRRLRGP